MLNWSQRFNIFCFLDNQEYNLGPHHYECLLAAGARSAIDGKEASLQELDAFLEGREWVFGHLSYELKNVFFNLAPSREDQIGFAPFFFFEPQTLLFIQGKSLVIDAVDPDAIYGEIFAVESAAPCQTPAIPIQQRLTKEAYLEKVALLQQHIRRGDCYEINFCQEFFAQDCNLHPVHIYQQLVQLSPTPFSAFYRIHSRYLMCASPERFMQKKGGRLIAQPMKGTAKRHATDRESDQNAIQSLKDSAKERAENVMIVDLMRNDLSRICASGTVSVSELFGVQTFPQVHQMVSTVEGVLQEGTPFSKVLEATFPMGSMTGAPKKRVLELIDAYEASARGLFSGSIGYFHQGDFDFNVVIRSILYNEAARYLSYGVGSGITVYSDPQKEWEECLLKGAAIKKVLTG